VRSLFLAAFCLSAFVATLRADDEGPEVAPAPRPVPKAKSPAAPKAPVPKLLVEPDPIPVLTPTVKPEPTPTVKPVPMPEPAPSVKSAPAPEPTSAKVDPPAPTLVTAGPTAPAETPKPVEAPKPDPFADFTLPLFVVACFGLLAVAVGVRSLLGK